MVETRKKNADTHPGNIVKGVSKPRRSSAEVAAARAAEEARLHQLEKNNQALLARIAELEAVGGARSQLSRGTGPAPVTPSTTRKTSNKITEVHDTPVRKPGQKCGRADVTKAVNQIRTSTAVEDPMAIDDSDLPSRKRKSNGTRGTTQTSSKKTKTHASTTHPLPLISAAAPPPQLNHEAVRSIAIATTRVTAGREAAALANRAAQVAAQPEDDQAPGSVNFGGYASDNDDEVEDLGVDEENQDSLVAIAISEDAPPVEPTPPPTQSASSRRNVKYNINHLPISYNAHWIWKKVYIAKLIAYTGRLNDPWAATFIDWQEVYTDLWTESFGNLYPVPPVTPGSPVWELSRQALSSWRHSFVKAADTNLNRIADADGFELLDKNTPLEQQRAREDSREQHIRKIVEGALLRPHYPFRSIAFRFNDTGKPVHRGKFQSKFISRVFAQHLISLGDRVGAKINERDGWPTGALALATTAVERTLTMYKTGRYVSTPGSKVNNFSHENWGKKTARHAVTVENLEDSEWPAIIKAAADACARPSVDSDSDIDADEDRDDDGNNDGSDDDMTEMS
ncbi:hypothetical protein BXZ70DRAFT_1003638 [Cristinia sonorae]|uniref:DUF6532 domain-containing protein n=1 Tax=Cristinia sonorae TaxID=1940300 RepID=A0A8K0UZ37_9AGAR|nr:hypothetical protein BXZ70DRAFT_1003638 [Cristinia sonorae]